MTVMLSLVLTGLLVRGLGVENYGFYTLIASLFILLDAMADFGSKIIGVKKIAKGKNESRIWRDVFWLRMGLAIGAFFLGLLMVLFWPGLREIRGPASLALLMIFLTVIAGSLEIGWLAKLKMEKKIVTDVLFSLLFLGIIYFNFDKLSLVGVYGGALIAKGLSLLVGIKLFKGIIKLNKADFFKIKKRNLKKILGGCWPMGVYLLIFTSYDRAVDSLMIERFMGVESVAWYGLAYKIYGVLIQPAYFFTASVFPLMSKGGEKNLYKKSVRLLLVGLVCLIPVAYILSPMGVRILAGEGYEMSVSVLRLLLLALVFAYLNHLNGFRLIAEGGEKKILKLGVLSLVFNLGLNIIFIPRFGVMGAAGVTVATEALSLILMTIILNRKRV